MNPESKLALFSVIIALLCALGNSFESHGLHLVCSFIAGMASMFFYLWPDHNKA